VLLPRLTVVDVDHCEEDWYAFDNNLRGTPRGSRKKPNAGREPTGHILMAMLCRGLEKNGHGQSPLWVWHGKCESDMAALCKSNGKDTF